MTLIAGGLLTVAAWIVGAAGLPEAHWPVVRVLPELLAGLLTVLAWRFRRSRIAVAAIIVAVSSLLLRGPLANPPGGPHGPAMMALALLLPVNLGLLVLLRDHPLQRPGPLIHLAAVAVQPWLAAAVLDSVGATGFATRQGWAQLLGSTHSALLAFLMAAVFTVLAFALRRGTFEVAMLWVLADAALAVLSESTSHTDALLCAAAQLTLLFAVIEDSYRLAYHDQLTGLPGRRALDESLSRLDGDYVVAMVDVDHFKKFNDRYGHDVGDQALRMVADELASMTAGGRAFRYGGEEFAVLFNGRSPAETRDALEALRRGIESRSFSIRSPKRPPKKPERPVARSEPAERVQLTVSIGAAGPGNRHPGADDVLRAADAALYRAKRRGRNRVVIEGVRALPRRKK
jgi:diguanylate cyclase (GGDEF)-like protein